MVKGLNIQPEGLTKVHLDNANIPRDYWAFDFKSYHGSEKAKEVTIKYLKDFAIMKEKGLGIIYCGDYGVGKTTLAMIVMKYLVRARWDVYCTSLGEIIETIQRSWKNDDEFDLIGRAREAEILFIDDIGKEHRGQTGFTERVFDNLIRFRFQHRLPTFFTTNLTKSELSAGYGDSVISLFEGHVIPVTVAGDDYRRGTLKQETRSAVR